MDLGSYRDFGISTALMISEMIPQHLWVLLMTENSVTQLMKACVYPTRISASIQMGDSGSDGSGKNCSPNVTISARRHLFGRGIARISIWVPALGNQL